jgi:hypothetical protein
MRFHGIVLNQLSTGTTLPFHFHQQNCYTNLQGAVTSVLESSRPEKEIQEIHAIHADLILKVQKLYIHMHRD